MLTPSSRKLIITKGFQNENYSVSPPTPQRKKTATLDWQSKTLLRGQRPPDPLIPRGKQQFSKLAFTCHPFPATAASPWVVLVLAVTFKFSFPHKAFCFWQWVNGTCAPAVSSPQDSGLQLNWFFPAPHTATQCQHLFQAKVFTRVKSSSANCGVSQKGQTQHKPCANHPFLQHGIGSLES